MHYFAERISGDIIEVVFPEIDGDPAFWNPSAEEVVAFQEADLILLNGASYAKWVDRVSLPPTRMVNTSAGFADSYLPLENQAKHTHGPGGQHEHGDVAFTTWLDPQLAIQHATAIHDAFVRAWPSHRDQFAEGFEALNKDLADLDEELAGVTSVIGETPLVMSHPVYQYLAARYALNTRSVHWEPDISPTPSKVKILKNLLAEHPSNGMVWEGEPHPESLETLNSLGIRSVVFSPCANRPEAEDYLSVMKANAKNLRAISGQ